MTTHKHFVRILHRAVAGNDGLDEGVAVVDGGEPNHAAIEIAWRAFGQQALSKWDEGAVHVVWRDRRGDAIEIGSRQSSASGKLWSFALFGQHIAARGAGLQPPCPRIAIIGL